MAPPVQKLQHAAHPVNISRGTIEPCLAAGSEKLLSLNTTRQESRLAHISTAPTAAPAAATHSESPPPPGSPFISTGSLSPERQALLPSRHAPLSKGLGSSFELQTGPASAVSAGSPGPTKVPVTTTSAAPSGASSPGRANSTTPLPFGANGQRPVAQLPGAAPGRQSPGHHMQQGLLHVAANSSMSPSRVLPSRERGISPARLADLQKQNEALRHKLQVLLNFDACH